MKTGALQHFYRLSSRPERSEVEGPAFAGKRERFRVFQERKASKSPLYTYRRFALDVEAQ